jgi:tRNA-Thr(GGU) m(6)t(6)A37 methyltransferase TsaA
MTEIDFSLTPIGFVESPIVHREDAPSQGDEGAPDVWINFNKNIAEGLEGIQAGDKVIVLTWFHQSRRDVLKLHPRWDKNNPLTGVFNTRSPDRPNPIGIHPVTVRQIDDTRIQVSNMEAIHGTPILDVKPVI